MRLPGILCFRGMQVLLRRLPTHLVSILSSGQKKIRGRMHFCFRRYYFLLSPSCMAKKLLRAPVLLSMWYWADAVLLLDYILVFLTWCFLLFLQVFFFLSISICVILHLPIPSNLHDRSFILCGGKHFWVSRSWHA